MKEVEAHLLDDGKAAKSVEARVSRAFVSESKRRDVEVNVDNLTRADTDRKAKNAKARKNIRLSKLYSYGSCMRPVGGVETQESASVGGPGFSRVVFANHSDRHRHKPYKYRTNYVSTTKYNVFTFFPKSLFEQFRRVANLYFLLAAALSLTPVSPFKPASLIAPLVFVVGVSMLKEALEDWKRFMQDNGVNNRKVLVHVGNGEFLQRQWKKLRVGDVVMVEKDQFFPADLLLLSSNYPDGICYVETMNLDGETNLKLKRSLERTMELDDQVEFNSFEGVVRCEDPNPSLYTFIGNLETQGNTFALGPEQILLRDSKLRNTNHIYGAVIFTGHDTKVMMNATDPPSKRTRIERKMDLIIYMLFGVLVLISLIGSVVFGLRTHFEMPKMWYLRPDKTDIYYKPSRAAESALLHLVTALILYGYLIPISLYVSIEIVKVLQAMFINQDIEMYHEETDTPARARTSNLNEELGQVDTILSDKTGTLTCNQMDFLKCSIGGIAYGRGVTEVERATAKRLGQDVSELDDAAVAGEADSGNGADAWPDVKGFGFRDSRLMDGHWVREPNSGNIQLFFRILAVCHTAIPDTDEETGVVTYEAESPDEAAFVVAAREFGFEFYRRTQSSVELREPDISSGRKVKREYKILNVLEFNSTRKRMSVVLKDEDDQIWIFCKGADSVIFERLAPSGKMYATDTKAHLAQYGDSGLRTLALAYRKLSATEYEEWSNTFQKAKQIVGPDHDLKVDAASELVERDLILVGATAVEDKLQKGVPECIDRLAQAGLKIWVLTGDKVETAINIGFACSLLRQGMQQIIISLDTPDVNRAEEFGDKDNIAKVSRESVVNQISAGADLIEKNENIDSAFALIIDGKSLTYALENDMKKKFLALAVKCASVVCCRVSPKQKALVTRLVKEGTGRTTLGIGDGANDVGMIQEADIGIGISGVEGMQAVMASDFAIAQFRFLERLLVVHGHWCYRRIALMICYFFYKNITFGLTIFYFEAYTMFSGQTLYNDWFMSLFNVIFTSLPVIALGVFEQDISSKVCMQFPAIYQQGPSNMFFNWSRILGWMFNGLYSSVILYWFVVRTFLPQAFRANGQTTDLEVLGAAMYTVVIWAVNAQLALVIGYFTWIQHFVIWGSIAAWYVFMVVYGSLSPNASTTAYKVFTETLAPSSSFWISTLMITVACLLPYFAFAVVQRAFKPLDHHVIQEIHYLDKHNKDPEMWSRERKKAVQRTSIGLSARVEAGIKQIKGRVLALASPDRSKFGSPDRSKNVKIKAPSPTPDKSSEAFSSDMFR